MSYATYITDALVCGTYNRSSADRSFALFTREAGLLYAEARSVREERSRQRYALEDFSLIRVSLIKGRQTWKIGSVEAITNYFRRAETQAERVSVVRLGRNLRRFIHGEEASPLLFDFVVEALEVVVTDTLNRDFVDLYIELKLLTLLGYARVASLPPHLQNLALKDVEAVNSREHTAVLSVLIEKGILNSQL